MSSAAFARSAAAADKKALVVETKKKGFKDLGRGLRVTLKQNHNYETIKDAEFSREAKKTGVGTGAKTAQMVEIGKKLGADLLIFAFAEPGKGGWSVVVKADATDGRGSIFSQTYTTQKAKLERSLATEIARDIRAADASGKAAAATIGDDMTFSLDEAAPAETPASAAGMSFDLGASEVAIKAAPKQLQAGEASAQNEEDAAAESSDDEFYEPTDELTDTEAPPRYVAPDGRAGFVGTVGYAMLARNTGVGATNGTPPAYHGVLSPGVAINLQLFPRRFKEGGGIARDFGAFARAVVSFMPSSYVQSATITQYYTNTMVNAQAGLHYRHVFGNQEKSVAFGGQLGIAVDQMQLDKAVPLPTQLYISPVIAAEFEAPIYKKYAVFVLRAGVLPISSISKQAVETFGLYKWAFGVSGALGVHSTIYNDMLYLDLMATVTNYWQQYTATGTSRFQNITMRDTIVGASLAVGIAY